MACCSWFESRSVSKSLAAHGDVLVPDFKVWSEQSARQVNLPGNYGEVAQTAIETMMRTHHKSHFTEEGNLAHGLLIRHLMMPGFFDDTLSVIEALGRIGYAGHINFMTYFINPALRQMANANPREVLIAKTAAESKGMRVLVNGKLATFPQSTIGQVASRARVACHG